VIGGQYGEDVILGQYYGDKADGFVVDVGAADGVVNSNSYRLLSCGWSGVLIEPDPIQYVALRHLWQRRADITCLNCACGTVAGDAVLHACYQISTLNRGWREKREKRHGSIYREVAVKVLTLNAILEAARAQAELDFLSIDCEGQDTDVLASIDLRRYKPRLICVEDGVGIIPGYRESHKTVGNVFYERIQP
jgi:FkbM family methyltransferase